MTFFFVLVKMPQKKTKTFKKNFKYKSFSFCIYYISYIYTYTIIFVNNIPLTLKKVFSFVKRKNYLKIKQKLMYAFLNTTKAAKKDVKKCLSPTVFCFSNSVLAFVVFMFYF